MEFQKEKGLDDDILQVIQEISFITEKYTLCSNQKRQLEKTFIDLNNEIAKARESEKNNINALSESRKLISEQKLTISKLMYIKDEIKQHKDEVLLREKRIRDLELEKKDLLNKLKEEMEIKAQESNKIQENFKLEVSDLKNEINTLKSQSICSARAMEEEMLQLKSEKDDQINRLVLEYEEKLQRARAQYIRMKDEMHSFVERTNKGEATYKEKISSLEQKLLLKTNIVTPNTSSYQSGVQKHPTYSTNRDSSQPQTFVRDTSSSKIEFTKSSYPTMSMNENYPQRMQSDSSFNQKQVPFKIVAKSKNPQQRAIKPFPVKTTYNEALSETSVKPQKRKLFSKFSEEFHEID